MPRILKSRITKNIVRSKFLHLCDFFNPFSARNFHLASYNYKLIFCSGMRNYKTKLRVNAGNQVRPFMPLHHSFDHALHSARHTPYEYKHRLLYFRLSVKVQKRECILI